MFCIRFLHLYNSAYFASAQRTRIENNRNKNGKNDNNLYNVIQNFSNCKLQDLSLSYLSIIQF